jgi:hypothetical protein
MHDDKRPFKEYSARHFSWQCSDDGRVATITLNRPQKKNPLTFESYAELRDLFRNLAYANDVRAVVVAGEGGNFCSGGDVFEIIEPLTKMAAPELLRGARVGVRERHVGCVAGLYAERHAHDLRLHVVERGGFGVEGEELRSAEALQPEGQPRALEAGVPGQQHAAATPECRV